MEREGEYIFIQRYVAETLQTSGEVGKELGGRYRRFKGKVLILKGSDSQKRGRKPENVHLRTANL